MLLVVEGASEACRRLWRAWALAAKPSKPTADVAKLSTTI